MFVLMSCAMASGNACLWILAGTDVRKVLQADRVDSIGDPMHLYIEHF